MSEIESLYCFPTRLESLNALLRHVKDDSRSCELALVLRAQTAVEELFVNAVSYGQTPPGVVPTVWLGVQAAGQHLFVQFEDNSCAFDPFQGLEEVQRQIGLDLEHRQVGGLGRLLVVQLSDQRSYQRRGNINSVQLVFSRRDRATTL